MHQNTDLDASLPDIDVDLPSQDEQRTSGPRNSGRTATVESGRAESRVIPPEVLLPTDFDAKMKDAVNYKICSVCQEIDLLSGFEVNKSRRCSRCRRKGEQKFTKENNMIPDEVPPALKNLTFLEEMLISKQLAHMYIARLKTGGQFSYKNHVIAFPQDVNTLTSQLPRRVSDSGILVVRKAGLDNTHRDYRVRRKAIYDALIWLKANNPHYHDIVINQQNLPALPEDGLPTNLPTEVLQDQPTCPVPEDAAAAQGEKGEEDEA